MAYEKINWSDRIVDKPLTFVMQDNGDGTTTLIPAEGTVLSEGTPITSSNLNHLETQYDESLTEINKVQKVKLTNDLGNPFTTAFTDCNNVIETGYYLFNNYPANRPVSGTFILFHLQQDPNYAQQMAFSAGSGVHEVHFRNKADGTWNGWQKTAMGTDIVRTSGATFTGAVYAPTYWENGIKISDRYAPWSHQHSISQITDLQNQLNIKADRVQSSTEYGYYGVGGMSSSTTTSAIAGSGVNYKFEKSYTPSSVTFTPLGSTATPNAIQITHLGFFVYINGSGTAGQYLYSRGHYTA